MHATFLHLLLVVYLDFLYGLTSRAVVEGNAMPCRVAFERGKERSVYLLVAHKERDAASWLLLAEDTPSRNGHGIVRVIAPLAGSKVQSYEFSYTHVDAVF